jgi:ABC-type nitrate/sulfonate/bicarbonate transport system ATPase subunit
MAIYTENEPLIQINNLEYRVGDKLLLRDVGNEKVPFCIKDVKREHMLQGQIVAVVGRSGRGKSTLFKLIAGLTRPTKGSITIPKNFTEKVLVPVEEGDVGFVQQFYPLSRNQTVSQMLNDAARQGKIPQGERKKVIESYLEDWGLIDQQFHSTRQLSGGQRQRVAIIEQLLCSHYFIIMDEPFSGLDVKNIEDVKTSLHKINESNDINTVIFSTHDIEIAVEIADSIYVVGYEKEDKGDSFKDGGTLLEHVDLKKLGLAWQPMNEKHLELIAYLKGIILRS